MAKTPPPSSRRAARETALRVLYTLAVGKPPLEEALEETIAAHSLDEDAAAFTRTLVKAVVENRVTLDRAIRSHAIGYPPERQTIVDRAILQLATAEATLSVSDAGPAVIATEAVELAKKYSTPEAARFVHGVLGALLAQSAAPAPAPSESQSAPEESPVA